MFRRFSEWGMPVIISLLMGWTLVNEYRDHGWQGIVIILLIGALFGILTFGTVWYLLDRRYRRRG